MAERIAEVETPASVARGTSIFISNCGKLTLKEVCAY